MRHSAQCGKTRNSLSLKKNSSKQLFCNFFSKTITFTKFLRKKCEREFSQCERAIPCLINLHCFHVKIDILHNIIYLHSLSILIRQERVEFEIINSNVVNNVQSTSSIRVLTDLMNSVEIA